MCNNTSENKACAQGKIIFYRTGKATEVHKVGDMFCPAHTSEVFARGVTQGSGKMTADAQMIPRSIEICKDHCRCLHVGDIIVQHLPMRILPGGETKARSPSIRKKDMEVMVSLCMQT